MANYLRALGCCDHCAVRRVPSNLRGYRAVMLEGLGTPPASGTPALLPVSDRKAIAAAIRLFQRGERHVVG